MFTWLNKQGVASDSGFMLQRVQRFFYEYSEKGQTLRIAVEPGLKYEEIRLPAVPRWQPPHEAIVVDGPELARVIGNVTEALTFMGIQHKIERE